MSVCLIDNEEIYENDMTSNLGEYNRVANSCLLALFIYINRENEGHTLQIKSNHFPFIFSFSIAS